MCFVMLLAVYEHPLHDQTRPAHKTAGARFLAVACLRAQSGADEGTQPLSRRHLGQRSRPVASLEETAKMVDEKLKKTAIKEGEWPELCPLFTAPFCGAPWRVAMPRADDAAV